MPLIVDIESRSSADIKTCGADAYSRHPSSEVLCVCAMDTQSNRHYKFDTRHESDVVSFLCGYETIIAHNVAFEYAMFGNVLNIDPEMFLWIDTMDIAAYLGAPLSLEGSAEFLLGDDDAKQKDKEGKKLMRKICVPRKVKKEKVYQKYTEEEFQGLVDYCMQDVVVSAELYKNYWHMIPEFEKETMLLTQRINRGGIPVDMPLVHALLDFYEGACKECEAPEGLKPSDARRTSFILEKAIEWEYPIENVQAETVKTVLNDPKCPDELRTVFETRQVLTLASIKKLNALVEMVGKDGVVRNGFVYHGAKSGRFAGRGVQPQNLPRGYKYDVDIVLARCLVGVGI